MLTIKDIAHLAGVSRGTVDRVLNNRGSVKPETAEKVRSIIKAVNYTPNLAGKSLAIKKKNLKLGFILFDPSKNPFFKEVLNGIHSQYDILKDYGIHLELRYTDLDTPERQIATIEELQQEGIHGLAITAINHPLVVKKLKDLTSKGIPVVTANSDIPDCGRIAYIGSNYYESGKTAAGLLHLICNSPVNVGIVIGSHWMHCDSQRVSGFSQQIADNYSNIKIVHTAVNLSDDIESYTSTRQMLQKFPEINALYLAASGIKGACRAVSDMQLNDTIKILSHDAAPDTCRLIEEGVIAATITQQPFVQGTKPLEILTDYLGMGIPPESEHIYTKIEIKIKENLFQT